MFRALIIFGFSICFFSVTKLHAQFSPINLTGQNEDVIAEGGPSSLATTSAALDAAGSNKVMYTTAFAGFAGIAGGLPNNGFITVGPDTYSLGNTNDNNALFVFQGQTLSLFPVPSPPASKLRVLCFSTEGPSTVNIRLYFTDGSSTGYISNYILPDWFYGTTNIITQGFGRCSRTATGPWTPDGLPSNPKLYYIEIVLNCTDKTKVISAIEFSNVSTSPNAPFPNAVFMGVSAMPSATQVTPLIIPADCSGANGSISLAVTGSGAPYTYSWNTVPIQTGPTATGLNPGTYTCTITDALGCTSTTYTGTVPLNNNATMTASATPAIICPGTSVQLNSSVGIGTLTTFTWNPGNLPGASVSVSPATTTTYTVTGTNSNGCNASAQVTVTVNPVPSIPVASSVTVCSGTIALLQVVFPQAGVTYNWYDAASGGTLLYTGTFFTTPPLTSTTTYYIEAVSAQGCRSNNRGLSTVTINPPPAAATAGSVSICSGTNAVLNVINPQAGYLYGWFNSPLGGSAIATGTSFTVINVTSNTTYYLETVSNTLCTAANRTPVTISLVQPLATPVVTVTNLTQTSMTFSWTAIPGATGYEISTNGGASFQPPSSGTTGTTHTISGLPGNTTITLVVRALGTQPCETSSLSAVVSGTTLSTKTIFVPNVFTPNGDSKNDKLFVYGNYVRSMQFRIFNQWGQLIFSSDNISQGWDGTYKGQQQPIGVYAYTLKVVLNDNSVINKKGSINLIR